MIAIKEWHTQHRQSTYPNQRLSTSAPTIIAVFIANKWVSRVHDSEIFCPRWIVDVVRAARRYHSKEDISGKIIFLVSIITLDYYKI